MIKRHLFLAASLLIPALTFVSALRADDTATVGGIAPKPLIDVTASGSETRFVASDAACAAQISTSHSDNPAGVQVTIAPGPAGYPGVALKAENGGAWDLSAFGHIDVKVTNTGTKGFQLGLRVDDSGGWKNNDQTGEGIKPGQTKTVRLIFGYTWGKPGYALKTSEISQVLLFTSAAKTEPGGFRIESIEAGGTPGEKPAVNAADIRITPKDGLLLGAGATALDAAKNIVTKGAQATLADANGSQNLTIVIPANAKGSAGIKPEAGRWMLTNSLEVRVKVRNDSKAPITPTITVQSNGGAVDGTADAPIAPGAEGEIVASYINPKIWKNTPPATKPDPGTGNAFASNQVASVTIGATQSASEQTLTVESINADLPAYSAPDWLGKRPPVDGEWSQTLDEEFNGPTLDQAKWNDGTPSNFWDQRTHFSKEELILKDGVMTERYEKKTGTMNDEPGKKETDYADGYLDTYGKWVQRYGYFEARVKVPTAPGLWPAFWLMPDRGAAAGPQWKRSDTANGGMEFDIMEFLSGWGPCRYNIAMHWDGYLKNHKATGSTMNYVQPDKDGYITTGLLWTPGVAAYYCNGKEILHFESDRVSTVPSFIILDMVSGGWDNTPLDDAKLPDAFVIDYVRCWQRKDLASEVDGLKTASAAPAPAAK